MLPIVAQLMSSGLTMLGNAVLAKGKDVVEEKLGIKFPEGDKPLDPSQVVELKKAEMAHEEWLIEAGIRKAQQEIEAEKVAQGNVTERWKSDMTSDSWLSKNIRPLTLAYWTVAITVLIVLESALATFQVKEAWINLVETSYTIVLAAYFVGRTVQHVQKMRSST